MRGEVRPALERGEVACAERQLGAPALSPRDHPRRREVAGGVAEGEAVVGGAPFAQVHGEGHDGARRHRVQPQLVARLVEGGDGGEVADAAVGAAEAEGLELRALAHVVAEPVHLAAGQRALGAGADLGAHALQLLGLERGRLVELPRAPVARGQGAGRVDQLDEVRRALLPGPGVVGGEDTLLLQGQDVAREGLVVADGDGAGAAHDDRLEVLAAHHGSRAAASGLVVLVGREAGEGDEPFAGGARGEDLVPRAHLVPDLLLEGRRLQTPEAALGRQELHPVVLDQHEHRVRRLAGDDHQVVPGELELRGERPADVGVEQRAGGRALAADGEARARRHRGAGERAGREDERVAGRECIGARRELVEEVAEQEALAADVQAGPVLREGLDGRRLGGQVEPQHTSGVEVHGPPRARGPGHSGAPGPVLHCRIANRPVNQ